MTESLRKKRDWNHQWVTKCGNKMTVSLLLDEERIQHFRNLNRFIGEPHNWPGCYYEQYASFWVWKGGESEIRSIVSQLEKHYSRLYGRIPKPDRHYANFLKDFVASFPYQYDDRSIGHMEYAKFPIEMLYDKEGDCECLSFFLASILAFAGFTVSILVGYTKPGLKGAHAATGLQIMPEPDDDVVEDGGRFLYCEAVSDAPVGRCGFSFEIFQRNASVWHITPNYRWDGQPPHWSCINSCGILEPWIDKCPSCGQRAIFNQAQIEGDSAADWDSILRGFLDHMEWLRKASTKELANEIIKINESKYWGQMPVGNKNYFIKALESIRNENSDSSEKLIEGARPHLLSAWPHIVASVFCQAPEHQSADLRVDKSLRWLGMSVYEMSNPTLAAFSRKILSDTTCKRIQGFSTGSRLAIGRILSSYEHRGEEYMKAKRGSIENLLVKVVIPQVFTLLARESSQEHGVTLPQSTISAKHDLTP